MNEEHVHKMLGDEQPRLSDSLRVRMWTTIKARIGATAPVVPIKSIPSPFIFTIMHTRMMVPVALVLTILLGTSGAALASESARPGDFLFPVDRAIEDMLLSVTLGDEERAKLLQKFSDERLNELHTIIEEEVQKAPPSDAKEIVLAQDEMVHSLEIEVYVYNDITTIKIELNDKTKVYFTHAKTKDGVIDAITTQLPFLTRAQIEAALNFEVGDRESDPKDRGEVVLSNDGNARISNAVRETVAFLDKSGHSDNPDVFGKIHDEVNGIVLSITDDRIRARGERNRFERSIDDDGDERVEIRDGDTRVRVREKDGEIEVRVRNGDDSHDGFTGVTSNDSDLDSASEDNSSNGSDDDDSSDDNSGSGGSGGSPHGGDSDDSLGNTGLNNSSDDSIDDSNSGKSSDDSDADDVQGSSSSDNSSDSSDDNSGSGSSGSGTDDSSEDRSSEEDTDDASDDSSGSGSGHN